MWVFCANQAVRGLVPMLTSRIYGFCDSWQDYQNGAVHGSLSKVFEYNAKPRLSLCHGMQSGYYYARVLPLPTTGSHIRVVTQLSHQSD